MALLNAFCVRVSFGYDKGISGRSCVLEVAGYVKIVWFKDEIVKSNVFQRLDMNGATINSGLHRLVLVDFSIMTGSVLAPLSCTVSTSLAI